MKTAACFIALILLIGYQTAQAQVYKLRSTGYSYKFVNDQNRWTDWADWEDASILITVDADRERITIFSSERQVYDIAEDEGVETDKDGDDVWSLYCVNEDGAACRLRIVFLKSQGDRKQIYVDFSDMSFVYNVYALN